VIGQIALSAILLMGAGVFVHTLVNLNRTPLGFEADHILLFRLNPPQARYDASQMITLYKQLEEKLVTISGVRSVTMSNIAIIGDGHSGSTFQVSGRPPDNNAARVQTNGVGVDFFPTLGIPILQGRGFTVHDTASSPRVAVVNRALARKFFAGENSVGKTFQADADDADGPIQIVGIAADTRYADLRSETPPTFYVPYQQRLGASRMVVEIRTAADPGSILAQARETVESVDRDLPLIDVRTMKEQVKSTLADERALAQLTVGFSVLAVVLASIGIYGIMSYAVTARTGEIGLHIALGARAEQVLVRVLREAFWLTSIGIALGLATALWLTRFISHMLYGIGSADPVALGGTALLLGLVALIAALAPARRASLIDPIRALRHD
jgi:predicted permease